MVGVESLVCTAKDIGFIAFAWGIYGLELASRLQ